MILALDIGGTKITSAFWNGKTLEGIERFDTPKVSAQEFLDITNNHLKERLKEHSVTALGVSSAGPINVRDSALINPVNLGNGDSSWSRVDLKNGLLPRSTFPKWVDSDAALAAYAQYCRGGRLEPNLVAITIGTGIGVGAIVEGKLVRAGRGMHPELGHLIISELQDKDFHTPFSNFGTIESFLSGHFFSLRMSQMMNQPLTGADVIRLAESGNEMILTAFDHYSKRMAIAIANICLVYAPSLVTLAGGFAERASPFFLPKTLNLLNQILESRTVEQSLVPKVEIALDTHHLSLLGAAYAAEEFKP